MDNQPSIVVHVLTSKVAALSSNQQSAQKVNYAFIYGVSIVVDTFIV